MKFKAAIVIACGTLWVGSVAHADTVDLDSLGHCIGETEVNGIAKSNVTGNNGGSDDCWGTADGNTPTDSFTMGTMTWNFVSKSDMSSDINDLTQIVSGTDIGLNISGYGADGVMGGDGDDLCWVVAGAPPTVDCSRAGGWSYDPAKFNSDSFLVVLKAANNPGYAVWLFDPSSASTFGTWLVAWNKGISHISIYSKGTPVPEPATLALFGLGLLGAGLARRRKVRR